MNKEEAIEYLRNHQPMPTDDEWDSDTQKLEDVRKYFLNNPDKDCIKLFLNIFPDDNSSGYGVYQLIEDVIGLFSPDLVLPHISKALKSPSRNTRYWNAQIAAVVPHLDLIPLLADLLKENDFDMSYAAITALDQIDDISVKEILEQHLKIEKEEEIKELIGELISD